MIKGNITQGPMTPAIVLVDYANVCSIISDLLGEDHNPDELAIRMAWSGYITDASGDFQVKGRLEVPVLVEDVPLEETEILIFDEGIDVQCDRSNIREHSC